MAFKVKRAGKKESPASEGKMSEDATKRGPKNIGHEDEGEDHEKDGEDPDVQARRAAGKDLIDAIGGGDGHEVYKAHKHLMDIHGGDASPVEEEANESEDASPIVKEIRSMKRG